MICLLATFWMPLFTIENKYRCVSFITLVDVDAKYVYDKLKQTNHRTILFE
jgi:hypothetical protein